ncbi:MAG TPA: hypothetical protein PLB21_11790, partial [Actinomycetota bacterium]|nr:hypothetical protein [Actinomycetota bacterium]
MPTAGLPPSADEATTPARANGASLAHEARRTIDPRLTVADLEAVLSSTGRPITDSRNGRVTPLVQAQRAVEQVRS